MKTKDRLVEITWLDACYIARTETTFTDSRDAMCKQVTVGRIYLEDDYGVILEQSTDETGGHDYFTIPKYWIIGRKYYDKA